MLQNQMNPKADLYFNSAKLWYKEMFELRRILLKHSLIEELKWGKPCYTFQGKNIVLIMSLKDNCNLLLFKGALLDDKAGVLVKPGDNSQAGRQIRFTSLSSIIEQEELIDSYLNNAIEVEKAGLKVNSIPVSRLQLPDELKAILDSNIKLKEAFNALTPGRQKAYIFYFAAAKKSSTRVTRIEKYLPNILSGKGLND